MARGDGTAQQKQAFLEALAATASVTRACALAEVPRTRVYAWRRTDRRFAAAWSEALERGTDALEDEAIRRAYEGQEKPVYRGKEAVGSVREYSDSLLMFLLKGRRPERYRDRAGGDAQDAGSVEGAREELDRRIDRLAAALQAQDDPPGTE